VSKQGLANSGGGTYVQKEYNYVFSGALQPVGDDDLGFVVAPPPAPAPTPPAQPVVQPVAPPVAPPAPPPVVQPVAPPAPPPVVRMAPPAQPPVVQAPAPAPAQDADGDLTSALGEHRAGAIITFANGTRSRVDVRGLDEPSRMAVRHWADRRGGFTTASREVPGKGTVLQIKRITPERAAAPAPPPAKRQRREPAPTPEPAPAPAPAPRVSDAVDADGWTCFCTTENKAEAMECWVCGLRRP